MAVVQVIPNLEKMKEIVEPLLPSKIVLCQPLKGGRNSRVYKFDCVNQQYLLAYEYDPKTRILLALGVHENFYRDLKNA